MICSNTKVSICIPVYNSEKFISDAITSALGQTYKDFELLIIDNASTDNTFTIAEEFAKADNRVRLVRNEINIGMVGNFNRCLTLATGKYIKFICADDILLTEKCLSEMVEAIESDESISLVACARYAIDENGREVKLLKGYTDGLMVPGHTIVRDCLLTFRNNIGEPSSVLFKREHVGKNFDPDLLQLLDLDFWLSILLTGNFFYIGRPLVGFRIHPSQGTQLNKKANNHLHDPEIIFSRYKNKVKLNSFWCHYIDYRLKTALHEHNANCEPGNRMPVTAFYLLAPLIKKYVRFRHKKLCG